MLPHPTIENQLNHSPGFAIPPDMAAAPRRHKGGFSLPCGTALGHPILSPCSLRQRAFNCRINKLTYTLKVPIDLIVGNPKYPQVIALQKSSTLGILFLPLAIIMLGTCLLYTSTLILFENGQPAERMVGVHSLDEISRLFSAA